MRNLGWVAVMAFALAASPLAAAPGDMSVATFLQKADALEKKGAMAMFSGDLKVLKREGEGAANAYRSRIKADRAAGRTPHSCPPEGKQSLTSKDLLAHLRSYPASKRSTTTMKVAFADMMKHRFPCN